MSTQLLASFFYDRKKISRKGCAYIRLLVTLTQILINRKEPKKSFFIVYSLIVMNKTSWTYNILCQYKCSCVYERGVGTFLDKQFTFLKLKSRFRISIKFLSGSEAKTHLLRVPILTIHHTKLKIALEYDFNKGKPQKKFIY